MTGSYGSTARSPQAQSQQRILSMGNIPSSESNLKRAPSLISKPKSLAPLFLTPDQSQLLHLNPPQPSDGDNNPVLRRTLSSRDRPQPSHPLTVPSVTIRRSRSANLLNLDDRLSAPPSYSEAIASRQAEPPIPHAIGNATGNAALAYTVDHRRAFAHSFGHGRDGQTAPAGSRHAHVIMIPSTAEINTVPETTERPASIRRSSRENPLELLRKFNTVMIIDDSSSMRNMLWAEVREALATLAEMAARFDADGIDVHFLNSRKVGFNMREAAAVRRLFDTVRPSGITPTGAKLEELLQAYLSDLERAKKSSDEGDTDALGKCKPVNFIVMTDGAPTDDPEPVIVQAARRLDAGHFPITQVGIQFVQIGSDPAATEALQELDDGLALTHGIRDIVDTTPYSRGPLSAEKLTKILLGGINRRVDKKGGGSVLN